MTTSSSAGTSGSGLRGSSWQERGIMAHTPELKKAWQEIKHLWQKGKDSKQTSRSAAELRMGKGWDPAHCWEAARAYRRYSPEDEE